MEEKKTCRIQYLGHSGFLVETPWCTIIFDYCSDYFVGDVLKWNPLKPLYVFVSHKHQDHYDRKIFEWKKQNLPVTYLLPNDMRMTPSYMQRIGISEAAREHIHFLGRRKKYKIQGEMVSELGLEAPSDGTVPVIEVETFLSTDAGTAYLLQIGNITIYHAGDLNWWTWEGQSEEEKKQVRSRYKEEIDRMKNRVIDIAFLPLDPKQGEDFFLGFDYFMRTTDTKMAFPMHCWGDDSIIQKLKKLECSRLYRDRVFEPSKEHTEFFMSVSQ